MLLDKKQLIYFEDKFYIVEINAGNTGFYVQQDFEKNNVDVKNFVIPSQDATVYKRKLLVGGLGYRGFIEDNSIKFKLNLSHPCEQSIPAYISDITPKKHSIFFESKDQIMLGNFVNKIYNLRPCNAYKRKGFTLSHNRKKLKPVRKK